MLVHIVDTKVAPLCSTYLTVIGDEVEWSEMAVLFAGAGADWERRGLPTRGDDGDPLDNPTARVRNLQELEARVNESKLVFNEGRFFDKWGRRFKIEEVESQ